MSRVRMAELRQQVQRDRILNYELSSRVLQIRIRDLLGVNQEFANEVAAGVFETQILNANAVEIPTLNALEHASLIGINIVRRLMFKRPLTLAQDTETWKKLSAAFMLERMRRFGSAARLYKQVLERGLTEDSQAFVMLHLGYCLAVQGEFDVALTSLEMVKNKFNGTHYSETATRIIELILSGDQESTRIEASNVSPLEKARRLASIGRCSVALHYFQTTEEKQISDLYTEAGCLEKTGQIPGAVLHYAQIAEKTRDQSLKREVNRRLLLAGEFYGGGKEVLNQAIAQAKVLGDATAVRLMQTAILERRKDVVSESEVLEQAAEAVQTPAEKPMLEEKAVQPEIKIEPPNQKPEIRLPSPAESKPPDTAPTEYALSIQTRGGRYISARSLTVDSSSILAQSPLLRVRLPLDDVASIAASGENAILRVYLTNGEGFRANMLQIDFTNNQLIGENTSVPLDRVARIASEKR
ncbi:MAG: hypothetical protein K8S54_02430 [Spirochaetia bacterium]|nr:hypothetical protein [Spirochaetia bacterium]